MLWIAVLVLHHAKVVIIDSSRFTGGVEVGIRGNESSDCADLLRQLPLCCIISTLILLLQGVVIILLSLDPEIPLHIRLLFLL